MMPRSVVPVMVGSAAATTGFPLPLSSLLFGFFGFFFGFDFSTEFFVFGIFGIFGFAGFVFVVDFFDRDGFVFALFVGFGVVGAGGDDRRPCGGGGKGQRMR